MHIERKGRGLIANYTFCIFSVLVANYESGAYRTWGSTTNQPRITQLTRRNGGKLVKVREICGKNSVLLQVVDTPLCTVLLGLPGN